MVKRGYIRGKKRGTNALDGSSTAECSADWGMQATAAAPLGVRLKANVLSDRAHSREQRVSVQSFLPFFFFFNLHHLLLLILARFILYVSVCIYYVKKCTHATCFLLYTSE